MPLYCCNDWYTNPWLTCHYTVGTAPALSATATATSNIMAAKDPCISLFITRPNRLHTVHRCNISRQMSHVAWSVCLSVAVRIGHTGELCINGWNGLDAVWQADLCGFNESRVRWDPSFPAKGNEMAMWSFAKFLWTFVRYDAAWCHYFPSGRWLSSQPQSITTSLPLAGTKL